MTLGIAYEAGQFLGYVLDSFFGDVAGQQKQCFVFFTNDLLMGLIAPFHLRHECGNKGARTTI